MAVFSKPTAHAMPSTTLEWMKAQHKELVKNATVEEIGHLTNVILEEQKIPVSLHYAEGGIRIGGVFCEVEGFKELHNNPTRCCSVHHKEILPFHILWQLRQGIFILQKVQAKFDVDAKVSLENLAMDATHVRVPFLLGLVFSDITKSGKSFGYDAVKGATATKHQDHAAEWLEMHKTKFTFLANKQFTLMQAFVQHHMQFHDSHPAYRAFHDYEERLELVPEELMTIPLQFLKKFDKDEWSTLFALSEIFEEADSCCRESDDKFDVLLNHDHLLTFFAEELNKLHALKAGTLPEGKDMDERIGNKLLVQALKQDSRFYPMFAAMAAVNRYIYEEWDAGRMKLSKFLIVGGMWRDLISGMKLPKDADIACAGNWTLCWKLFSSLLTAFGYKIELEKAKDSKAGGRTQPISIFTFEGMKEIEIAPFRLIGSEKYDKGGRLISVELRGAGYDTVDELIADLVYDVLRRDVTINGIYMDPQSHKLISLHYENGVVSYIPGGDWTSLGFYEHARRRIMFRVYDGAFTDDPARDIRISVYVTLYDFTLMEMRDGGVSKSKFRADELHSLFNDMIEGRPETSLMKLMDHPIQFVQCLVDLGMFKARAEWFLYKRILETLVPWYNEIVTRTGTSRANRNPIIYDEVKMIFEAFNSVPEPQRKIKPISDFLIRKEFEGGALFYLALFLACCEEDWPAVCAFFPKHSSGRNLGNPAKISEMVGAVASHIGYSSHKVSTYKALHKTFAPFLDMTMDFLLRAQTSYEERSAWIVLGETLEQISEVIGAREMSSALTAFIGDSKTSECELVVIPHEVEIEILDLAKTCLVDIKAKAKERAALIREQKKKEKKDKKGKINAKDRKKLREQQQAAAEKNRKRTAAWEKKNKGRQENKERQEKQVRE